MLKIYKISEVTDIIAVYSDQILNLATIHDAILANDGNLLILVETSENAVLGKKERITDTILYKYTKDGIFIKKVQIHASESYSSYSINKIRGDQYIIVGQYAVYRNVTFNLLNTIDIQELRFNQLYIVALDNEFNVLCSKSDNLNDNIFNLYCEKNDDNYQGDDILFYTNSIMLSLYWTNSKCEYENLIDKKNSLTYVSIHKILRTNDNNTNGLYIFGTALDGEIVIRTSQNDKEFLWVKTLKKLKYHDEQLHLKRIVKLSNNNGFIATAQTVFTQFLVKISSDFQLIWAEKMAHIVDISDIFYVREQVLYLIAKTLGGKYTNLIKYTIPDYAEKGKCKKGEQYF